MTGFGKAVTQTPEYKVTIEVKSLNSKQMDISTRVPSSCREMELAIHSSVAASVKRGKVDLTLKVERTASEETMTVDIDAMRACKVQIENMRRELDLPEPTDWYTLLLRFPETTRNVIENDPDEEEQRNIFKTLGEALDNLTAFRRREGEKLEIFFAERIRRISELLGSIDPYEAERVLKIRARIEEGLLNLKKVDIDRSRLEQEMIFYIEKLDVTEEKQRLGAHLNYFLKTMGGEPGQGKKLGFIAQEMGREINTLGSKSNHAEMQRIVVKMKDELEQIKEQVLNVL